MGRPEKWTEKAALELGNELIAWMLENEEHIFWQEYIVLNRGLYKQIIHDLSKKWPSFSVLIKRARELQEVRLARLALLSGKPIGPIFLLKNHHGYADKQEIKAETVTHSLDTKQLAAATDAELKEMIRQLTSREGGERHD